MNVEDPIDVDDAELVRLVRDILGARLTAYVAGVQETRIVRAWADRTAKPSDGVAQRLRIAYRIAAQIEDCEGSAVTQAWFMGMNPELDDQSPARILRAGNVDTLARVKDAAKKFLES